MPKILFVCLGNICRSPTAEGIMIDLIQERGLSQYCTVDSAGTAAYHVGESADPRSQKTANSHGVTLPSKARQFRASDFDEFDFIFAMDKSNLRSLQQEYKGQAQNLFLFRDWNSKEKKNLDVPDPYYGGPNGFDEVFELCRSTCECILDRLIEEGILPPSTPPKKDSP